MRGKNKLAIGVTLAVFAFEMIPLLVIVSASFGSAAYVQVPPRDLTLAWYYRLFHEAKYLKPALNSVLLAALAVGLGVLIAAPSAYVLTRFRFRLHRLFDAVTLMPVIVPEIILAIALLQLWSLFGGYQSFGLAVVGHTVLAFPFVLRPTVASLANLDPYLEEAAMGLGASRLVTFRRVVLPHARVGLLAGAILGGIVSFEAFFMSLFLWSGQTLPIAIWEILRFDFSPAVLALSTIIILLTVPLLMIVDRTVGFKTMMRAEGR